MAAAAAAAGVDAGQGGRVLLLGGLATSAKTQLKRLLARPGLSGHRLLDSKHFPRETTHLIVGKLQSNEKVYGAFASGCWVLRPAYVTDSFTAGRWLAEADYEWGPSDEPGTSTVAARFACNARRWRQRAQEQGAHGGPRGAFVGMHALWLCSRKAVELEAIRSVLEAGGAQVSAAWRSEVTHVFAHTSADMEAWVQLASGGGPGMPAVDGVYCLLPAVVPSYLLNKKWRPSKFLMVAPSPQAELRAAPFGDGISPAMKSPVKRHSNAVATATIEGGAARRRLRHKAVLQSTPDISSDAAAAQSLNTATDSEDSAQPGIIFIKEAPAPAPAPKLAPAPAAVGGDGSRKRDRGPTPTAEGSAADGGGEGMGLPARQTKRRRSVCPLLSWPDPTPCVHAFQTPGRNQRLLTGLSTPPTIKVGSCAIPEPCLEDGDDVVESLHQLSWALASFTSPAQFVTPRQHTVILGRLRRVTRQSSAASSAYSYLMNSQLLHPAGRLRPGVAWHADTGSSGDSETAWSVIPPLVKDCLRDPASGSLLALQYVVTVVEQEVLSKTTTLGQVFEGCKPQDRRVAELVDLILAAAKGVGHSDTNTGLLTLCGLLQKLLGHALTGADSPKLRELALQVCSAFGKAAGEGKRLFLEGCVCPQFAVHLVEAYLCDYHSKDTVPWVARELRKQALSVDKLCRFMFFLALCSEGDHAKPQAVVAPAAAAPAAKSLPQKTTPANKSLSQGGIMPVPDGDRNPVDRARPPNGETTLHKAAKSGNIVRVQRLLSNGANPNYADPSGFTALWDAVNQGHTEVALTLLRGGADPNHRAGEANETALHLAVAQESVEMLRTLLLHGANADVADSSGQTARGLVGQASAKLCAEFRECNPGPARGTPVGLGDARPSEPARNDDALVDRRTYERLRTVSMAKCEERVHLLLQLVRHSSLQGDAWLGEPCYNLGALRSHLARSAGSPAGGLSAACNRSLALLEALATY